MILLIDTSTGVCRLTLVENNQRTDYEWEANRELAKSLLGWLQERLGENNKSLHDVTGIGVFAGPGSFTGLRIGITVMNTLADSLDVAIVSGQGEQWQYETLQRLNNGENDHIVLPYYGSEANITTPRK